MRLFHKNLLVFILGFISGILILYLTFYSARLHKRNIFLAKQFEYLLIHSVEISKNIELVKDSLNQLEKTSVDFSNDLAKDRRKINNYMSDGPDEPAEEMNLHKDRFGNFTFLQKNYRNLHRIIYHLQKSNDNIKQGSFHANSIPSIVPTQGRINSFYGMRRSPVTGKDRIHKGIDIAARIGTPVFATANGVVEFSGKGGRYGNMLIVEHGFGFKTRYAHIHEMYVKKGEKVTRGQTIAAVGKTGATTGAHLHYEVLLNNNHINPLPFIEQKQLKKISDQQHNHPFRIHENLHPTDQVRMKRVGISDLRTSPLSLKISFALGLIFVFLLFSIFIKFKLSFLYKWVVFIVHKKMPERQEKKEPINYWK